MRFADFACGFFFAAVVGIGHPDGRGEHSWNAARFNRLASIRGLTGH
jgi:hypothetical protein